MVAKVCFCEIQASLWCSSWEHCIWAPQKEVGYLMLKKMLLKVKSKFVLQVCGRTGREVVLHGAQPQLSHTTQNNALQLLWVSHQASWPTRWIFSSFFQDLLFLIKPHWLLLENKTYWCFINWHHLQFRPLSRFSQVQLRSFSLHSVKLLALSIAYLKLRLRSNCSW